MLINYGYIYMHAKDRWSLEGSKEIDTIIYIYIYIYIYISERIIYRPISNLTLPTERIWSAGRQIFLTRSSFGFRFHINSFTRTCLILSFYALIPSPLRFSSMLFFLFERGAIVFSQPPIRPWSNNIFCLQ